MKQTHFQLVKYLPENQIFRAVYFDGTNECFNNIIDLISKHCNGFIETSNPIAIYHHWGYKKKYMLKLPANHWWLVGDLNIKYNIPNIIDDKTFNENFEIL